MIAARGAAARLGEVLPRSRTLEGAAARQWAARSGAELVLFPESAGEVAAIVHAAAETGCPLMPAGGGSWLAAGGWGREARVAVSMSRMDGVAHYEPADLTLTAGAGLRMDDLAERLGSNGQWFPADGPGCDAGTLGAVVACGVSGPLQGRYGRVRDNVLGLEVVTGDGRALRIGGRVVKNVAGYDLVRLFSGSRGSLGIVTSVSVRLFPRPVADVTLCFRGGEAADAVGMARAVATGAIPVAAVELAGGGPNGPGGDRGAASGGPGGGGMAVVVRLLGGSEEVEEARARVTERVGAAPGEVLRGAGSAALHRRRMGWEGGPPLLVARLKALPARLGRTMEWAERVAGALGSEGPGAWQRQVTADALCGLVRVKGDFPRSRVDVVAECLLAAREAMEADGGSVTLSEAPRDLAARVGWTGAGGGAGGLTARIKALFDPDSLLAPVRP